MTLKPSPFGEGGGGGERTQDEDGRWEGRGHVGFLYTPTPWDALLCGFLLATADGVREGLPLEWGGGGETLLSCRAEERNAHLPLYSEGKRRGLPACVG